MNRPMLFISLMIMFFILCIHINLMDTLVVGVILIILMFFLELIFKFVIDDKWLCGDVEHTTNKALNFLYKIYQNRMSVYCVIICLFASGLLYNLRFSELNYMQNMQGECVIKGVVTSEYKDFIEISKVSISSYDKDYWNYKMPIKIKSNIIVKYNGAYDVGDCVFMKGRLTPFLSKQKEGEFDKKMFYASKNIDAELKKAQIIYKDNTNNKLLKIRHQIRSFIKSSIYKYMNYDDAKLAISILLGEKGVLDKRVKEDFINSSTAHVLVVSGLHFGILYAIILVVLSKLQMDYRTSQITALLFMAGFLFVVGEGFSAKRAFLMILLHSLSVFVHRRYDLLNSLGAVLFVSILYNPFCVFSVGLQMSVIAIIAIGFYNLYMPIVKANMFRKNRINIKGDKSTGSILMDIFLLPVVIQIAFIPHGIYHFHKIYPYGFLFNVPVLIIIPMLMLCLIGFIVIVSMVSLMGVGNIYIFLLMDNVINKMRIVDISAFVLGAFLTTLSEIVSLIKLCPYAVINTPNIKPMVPILIYAVVIILGIYPRIIIKFPTIQKTNKRRI